MSNIRKSIYILFLVILSVLPHKTTSAIYFEDGMTVPNHIEPLKIHNARIEINLEKLPDITINYSGIIQNNTPKNQILVNSNYIEEITNTKCFIGQNESSCPGQYIRPLLPALGSEESRTSTKSKIPTPLSHWISSYYGFFTPENSKDKEFQLTITLPNTLNTTNKGLINLSYYSALDRRNFNWPALLLQNNLVDLSSFEIKSNPNYRILPESRLCFKKYFLENRCFEFIEIRPNIYTLKHDQANFRDREVLYDFKFDEDIIKLDIHVERKFSMLRYWLLATFLPFILYLVYFIFFFIKAQTKFNKLINQGPWRPQVYILLKSIIPTSLIIALPILIKNYLLKLPTTPLFLPDLFYLFLIIIITCIPQLHKHKT